MSEFLSRQMTVICLQRSGPRKHPAAGSKLLQSPPGPGGGPWPWLRNAVITGDPCTQGVSQSVVTLDPSGASTPSFGMMLRCDAAKASVWSAVYTGQLLMLTQVPHQPWAGGLCS